jgi:haloalkane dehalogenase
VLAYREAGASPDRVALFVHGYPESSFMWRRQIDALAAAGWRAVAPDLPGYGDSTPDPPGTWERHMDALQAFVRELGLPPVLLVTHDWGVLIGLRWALDHPGSMSGLVISDGGFFPDLRHNGIGEALRTPGRGEALVGAYTRDVFGQAMHGVCPGITEAALDEYWKGLRDDARRMGHLELYRSGDFDKLRPYDGRLAALDIPALVMWGAKASFSDVRLAGRYQAEIPDCEVEIYPEAGHFIWEEIPRQTTERLVRFATERFPG